MVKQLFLAKSGEDMSQRIRFLITKCAEFRALTGYFYFSGVKVLYEAMRANPELKIRILVGMHAECEAGRVVEVAREPRDGETDEERFQAFCEGLRRVLGSAHVDNAAFHERVDTFARLMLAGKLEMRQTREPNHAKLYLFMLRSGEAIENALITGSSNLTEPGLGGQGEVNAQLMDYGWKEADAYFEELWAGAVPLTATEDQRTTLLRVIRDESVAAELTPYEAWLKVLWEYVESRKLELNQPYLEYLLSEAGMTYYTYQRDAVAQAESFLKDYNGAIIADVVGLGKSIVASLIGKLSRKRGLILCPPGVMGDDDATGGWKFYKAIFRLDDWTVMSSGNLDAALRLLEKDPYFDMVVVDEAHRFRNMGTDDYEKLLQICQGKQVVELTATPFNNKPQDLLALLRLFSPLKQSNLVPGGDLEAAFEKLDTPFKLIRDLRNLLSQKEIDWDRVWNLAEKLGLSRLAMRDTHDADEVARAVGRKFKKQTLTMRRLIENVTIRRNRLDLKKDPGYGHELKNLVTPEAPLTQFYKLTPEQNRFYDAVVREYFGEDGSFKGAIYQPGAYTPGETDISQLNLYRFMRRLFVQRFESSFGAFRQSVENQIAMMKKVRDFARKSGLVFYSNDANKDLDDLKDMEGKEFEEAVAAMVAEVQADADKKARKVQTTYRIDDPGFNKKAFFEDIESDLKLLRKVRDDYDACMTAENDPKAQALAQTLETIIAGKHPDLPPEAGDPRRKVIVFTEFVDTLKHLEKALSGSGLRCLIAYGMSKTVLENFDASLPKEDWRDDYDVILTTDKLSEGLNLNRAGAVVNYDIPWNPTRVIQRVGRINRMGQRVFRKLYILNYFPTLKGQTYSTNLQTAETKLWAIHQALGEDSQYFSPEEKPTAAALFQKIGGLPDDDPDDLSAYTKMKLALEAEAAAHPEELERVKGLPRFVKTAIGSGDAVYLFERLGQTFHALRTRNTPGETAVEEIDIDEALEAIRRPYDCPAQTIPPGFWGDGGCYSRLIRYEVKKDGAAGAKTQSNAYKAKVTLEGQLQSRGESLPHAGFVRELLRDISDYGTLADATLRKLWMSGDRGPEAFDALVESCWLAHGKNDRYLDGVPQKRSPDILVTVAAV